MNRSRPSTNLTWLAVTGLPPTLTVTSITNSKATIIIALSRPFDSNLTHHFLRRNLLSAETASNPRRPKLSPYLKIRIAELKAVFCHWEGDCKDVSITAAEEDHADEDRSMCSCTESSMEGPVDWDSLVDGGFERAIGEEKEEKESLVQGQVENVALGCIEDCSGTRVIQRKIGDPPPSKSVKLWKAILCIWNVSGTTCK